MKNIDKIKSMSVEEMAEFLEDHVHCKTCVLDNPCEGCRCCANEMYEWLESDAVE